MSYEVRWGDHVARKIAARFGTERTSAGGMSEHDFVCGPLAAAAARFRDFDTLPQEAGPSVRSAHLLDPSLGALVFVGVLVDERTVEVADFAEDDDYWDVVGGDPGD